MLTGRILVTGATGFIGQHLVNRLLAENNLVRILTRGVRPLPESWPGQVEIALGDLVDPAAVSLAVQDCQYIYHLAGEMRDPTQMETTNVHGMQHLLNACQQGSVSRVVYLSSVGVMGARRSGVVDETAPCQPQNQYEQTKYAAEQAALAWSDQSGVPVVALRPTIVFGDGPRAAVDSILAWLRAIQAKRFVFFDRRAVANYVYVGDVIAACIQAAQARTTGAFIIADSCPLVDFVAAAAEMLDVPAPAWTIPLPFAYVAAFGMQITGRLLRRSNLPLTVSRVRALSNRTRFCADHAASKLGWRPQIGYREGLRRTVNWYRQTGQLAQSIDR